MTVVFKVSDNIKEMMIEYNGLVNKLINITNNHNKNYTQYKKWQI